MDLVVLMLDRFFFCSSDMVVLDVGIDVEILLDSRCADVKNSARYKSIGSGRSICKYLNVIDDDDDNFC